MDVFDRKRETRVYPGSAPHGGGKSLSCLNSIDDDDLDSKGALSLLSFRKFLTCPFGRPRNPLYIIGRFPGLQQSPGSTHFMSPKLDLPCLPCLVISNLSMAFDKRPLSSRAGFPSSPPPSSFAISNDNPTFGSMGQTSLGPRPFCWVSSMGYIPDISPQVSLNLFMLRSCK